MTDEWDRWFRRRFPFFRGGIFDDIDRIFREIEEMMQREFEEFSRITPKNLIRERTLPDGSKYVSGAPSSMDTALQSVQTGSLRSESSAT